MSVVPKRFLEKLLKGASDVITAAAALGLHHHRVLTVLNQVACVFMWTKMFCKSLLCDWDFTKTFIDASSFCHLI